MAGLVFRCLLKVIATKTDLLWTFNRSPLAEASVLSRSSFFPSFRTVSSSSSTSVNAEFRCWKCGKKISRHLISCEHCETIQEIRRDFNYFTLFGLKQDFALNSRQLTTKFRQLQALFHPDKFAGKSEIEQEYSSSCSALLNAAYQTLIDPVERGLYVLRLENIGVDESELEVEDKQFLLEIMEINERLTDLDETSVTELLRLKSQNRTTIEKLLKDLGRSFGEDDLHSAKQTLGKLKYYNKIETKVKSLEIRFGIL